MLRYIDKLLASSRVKRPDLEKAIGLAMWVTVPKHAHLVAVHIS